MFESRCKKMFFKPIINFFTVPVSDKYKKEFHMDIDRVNVARAKITAATFLIMEAMMLVASFIIKKEDLLKQPGIYYGAMYILMIIAMAIYLLVFIELEKNIPGHETSILIAGSSFAVFILLWCAGISLLDQLSYGQIIIYVAAVISVAVTPFFEPLVLLLIYVIVHASFIILMPYFQKSGGLFGNYVNSTSILIISWVISCMRYKNKVEDFNNRKIIQEKSDELKRLNEELEEANRKLEKLSQTDSLTGIFNRLVFDRIIKAEWDRCKRHLIPLSLIMIDIDFFKEFNDSYGHQAGDDCIRRVAAVLSSCVKRSSDIAARYGGEAFAILLPHTEKQKAFELAEQIRKGVEELAISHVCSCVSEHVTISLGVYTTVPSDKSSIEEFIGTADKALYEAKRENRNNTVVA